MADLIWSGRFIQGEDLDNFSNFVFANNYIRYIIDVNIIKLRSMFIFVRDVGNTTEMPVKDIGFIFITV